MIEKNYLKMQGAPVELSWNDVAWFVNASDWLVDLCGPRTVNAQDLTRMLWTSCRVYTGTLDTPMEIVCRIMELRCMIRDDKLRAAAWSAELIPSAKFEFVLRVRVVIEPSACF